ncbi:MAG: hypothetical protein CVU48_08755 [Candidatus Cloacimonetes bacterium HGW-Cloacimonetes-1]|jgi:membrane protein|nr:MAG: hypothetical protein CVU48_08755 [Candidatus Cloacimonetes bacterium HGW-Cloacimonetes-1]
MRKVRKSFVRRVSESIFSYISVLFEDVFTTYKYLHDSKKRRQIGTNVAQFARLYFHRVTTEGVLKESAGLTYITLLSFVPFLTFIVMIIPDLPFLNFEEKFKSVIVANFLPGSANQIVSLIDETLKSRFTFNIMNFVILSITSYSIFKVIRDTFDRILSMEFKPSFDLLSQIIKFLGTLIFGLLISILLFSSSSLPIVSRLLKFNLLKQQLLYILPFVLQFVAFIFLFTILPSIKIRRSSLFRGAFWSTLVWVLVKSIFDYYIFNLTSYQRVYGVLAAIPIFLTWVYINWVIILGGIVLVAVIDQKDRSEIIKSNPQKVVKLTLEMYSGKKLNQKLEDFIAKKDLAELAAILGVEEDT